MRAIKSALRSDTVRRGLGALAALYSRVVRAAGRWRVEGGAIPEAFWRERKPFIPTFWHGRLLRLPNCWSWSVPMNMLISGHPDGRLISGAIGHLGLGVIDIARLSGAPIVPAAFAAAEGRIGAT